MNMEMGEFYPKMFTKAAEALVFVNQTSESSHRRLYELSDAEIANSVSSILGLQDRQSFNTIEQMHYDRLYTSLIKSRNRSEAGRRGAEARWGRVARQKRTSEVIAQAQLPMFDLNDYPKSKTKRAPFITPRVPVAVSGRKLRQRDIWANR